MTLISIKGRTYQLLEDSIANGRITYVWREVQDNLILNQLNAGLYKGELQKTAKRLQKIYGK